MLSTNVVRRILKPQNCERVRLVEEKQSYLTERDTILEPQNLPLDIQLLRKILRLSDLEVSNLRNALSGRERRREN